MKYGYLTQNGYIGATQFGNILFSTEEEYIEYVDKKEIDSDENDRDNERHSSNDE